MNKKKKDPMLNELPAVAAEYIDRVVKKMRYRKRVRREVQEELADHFYEALRDYQSDEKKRQRAQELIADFGDAKLLGILLRRAKKRCRPLWQKVLVRSIQAAGILILYIIICSSRFFIGSANITTDYAKWYTDKLKQGRDESLNAKPYFDRAVAMLEAKWMDILGNKRGIWPGDMNDADRLVLQQVLTEAGPALAVLAEGVKKPCYWKDYAAGPEFLAEKAGYPAINPKLMDSILDSLAKYRQLARLLAARALLNAYQGDVASAFEDTITLTGFGLHLQGKDMLIAQLVGIAIEQLASNRVFEILSRTTVSSITLERIQSELEKLYARHDRPIALDGEKVFWYDIAQHIFTDDGRGGGRVLYNGLPYIFTGWADAIWGLVSFGYPDRNQFLERVNGLFSQAEEPFDKTPWQRQAEKVTDRQEIRNGLILGVLGPAIDRIAEITWRLRTSRKALITVLAAQRFKVETGRYAGSLHELVQAGYLQTIVDDPYSDGPLSYRKTEDGFILYSFGENMKDDGGQLAHDRKGKIKQWADEGDWVFWPAEDD